MRRPDPKSFRRFNRLLLGVAAGVFVFFTAVNTRVNPLWVTPAPWTDDSYAEYRPIYRHQRIGKAGLVRSTPWQIGFFGSSRMDIAFDPQQPEWSEKKAANLAMSAGTLPETAAMLRYTLKRCPLELAIVGIDLGDITGNSSLWRTTGFLESPLNPDGEVFERELRYFGGISTFEAAVQTIKNRRKNELPEYTPLGFRARHQDKPDVRKIIQDDAISHAVRSYRFRQHQPADQPQPWKLEHVRQIISDARKHGCRLIFVIPPNHATYIGVFHYLGKGDPCFTADRRALAGVIAEANSADPSARPAELWDFNDFHPLNREPVPPHGIRMHWWLDGTHARRTLGRVMIARMLGWPLEGDQADYGTRLTPENLDARLQSIHVGYEEFQRADPGMWRWMAENADGYLSGTAAPPAAAGAAPEF